MNNLNEMVFVFGSNEAGRHGAGAALHAVNDRGAQRGIGYGHTIRHVHGERRQAFAIPTKDFAVRKTLELKAIEHYVDGFLTYAGGRPDLMFQITQIGCGLAGLSPNIIAPMFSIHPSNCYFDTAWERWLPTDTKYWGTHP